jgi:hypothetical protein
MTYFAGNEVVPCLPRSSVTGVIQVFQIGATASGEYSLSANSKASDPFTIFVSP